MKTRKLLVLDDDPAILDMLFQSLSDEGYQVITARNGHEGLHRVEHDNFDLILLDLMMPGMNGEQFLAEMRRIWPNVPPVVIVSADRNVSGKVRSLQVAGGVPKPFSLDDLLNQIERHLGGGGQPTDNGGYHAPGP